MISFLRPTKYTLISALVVFVLLVLVGTASMFMNDIFGPALAFLVYGPLFLFGLMGLPVVANGGMGWGMPTVLGFVLLIIFYAVISHGVGLIVSKCKARGEEANSQSHI